MKFLLIILLVISYLAEGQKVYAIRQNQDGSKDTIIRKDFTDSCFNKSNNQFVCFTREYYLQFYTPNFPNGFANFTQRADGIWINQNMVVDGANIVPVTVQTKLDTKLASDGNGSSLTGLTSSQITASANKNFVTDAQVTIINNQSGTNTGDNATNTQYSGLAASKQNVITTGTTAQYFRGDLSLATFPTTTAAFTNSTNKNFVTDAQATVIGNTSGTNTGDNATNTQYQNDFRAANFVAGTNYLAPNGNGSALTNMTASQVGLGNVTNESKATMFTSPTFTGTPTVPGYQPLATNLTSIGALANANGFLKNNGSGTFTYENPAGSGTVTNTGTLTSNSVILGNGGADTKVSTGITTNGTAQLVLGVNTTTLGSVKMFGNTSGDATIQPAAVAGTNTIITLPNVTSTLLPNTSTSGVAQSPTSTSTTQITHNLGRIPTIIRVYGIGAFTSNAAATPTPLFMGIFNSSGNRCVYMTTAGTTSQASQTSSTFAIFLATTSGNTISGVIQNVTTTTFDISWTETGTALAQNFIWEAQ